jgi:hypothetical protein
MGHHKTAKTPKTPRQIERMLVFLRHFSARREVALEFEHRPAKFPGVLGDLGVLAVHLLSHRG